MIRSIFVVIENRWQSSCLPTLVKIRSCDLDASQKRNATNECPTRTLLAAFTFLLLFSIRAIVDARTHDEIFP